MEWVGGFWQDIGNKVEKGDDGQKALLFPCAEDLRKSQTGAPAEHHELARFFFFIISSINDGEKIYIFKFIFSIQGKKLKFVATSRIFFLSKYTL